MQQMNPNWEKPPINWTVAGFFILTNLTVLTVIPWYGLTHGFTGSAWALAGFFWLLNGVGITAGYHRLWSHRTYEAHWLLRLFVLLAGSMALQNSLFIWASRHRDHHKHTDDNDRDPYSAGLGLWFSHMGWMVRDWPSSDVDFSNIKDLQADPMLRWQHKHYWTIVWALNLGLPLLCGWLMGDIMGVLLLAGVLRLVVNHHTTFFINSLAHFVGKQPYSDATSAKNSTLIATVTWGEGYHNYHHSFQNDYRLGVSWWQIDIGKWFIGACSWVGLARNLKRIPRFKIRRAQMQMLFKQAEKRLEKLPADQAWREKLEVEYEAFSHTVKNWQALQVQRMESAKQEIRGRFEDSQLHTRLKELEYSLRLQKKRLQVLLGEAAAQAA